MANEPDFVKYGTGRHSQGCWIYDIDAKEVAGRSVLRIVNATVTIQGSFAVYGNNVRILQAGTGVFIALLVDQLPRWWFVRTLPALTVNCVFGTTGYITPMGGIILSGATPPQDNIGPGATVDIASSHDFAIWGVPNGDDWGLGPAVEPTPGLFTSMGMTRKLSMPNKSPAVDPFFEQFTKDHLTQFGSWSLTGFTAPLPVLGPVGVGIWINVSYQPAELFTLKTTPAATPDMFREPWYMAVILPIKGATNKADTYLIGDLSQPSKFNTPYSMKFCIGKSILNNPRYNHSTIFVGFTPAVDEKGDGGGVNFTQVVGRGYVINDDTRDVQIAGTTPANAGQQLAGLQGMAGPEEVSV